MVHNWLNRWVICTCLNVCARIYPRVSCSTRSAFGYTRSTNSHTQIYTLAHIQTRAVMTHLLNQVCNILFFLSNLLYKMSELWEFQKTLNFWIHKISAKSLRPQTFSDKNLLTPMLAVCDACAFLSSIIWSDELWMPVPQFDNFSDFDNSEY